MLYVRLKMIDRYQTVLLFSTATIRIFLYTPTLLWRTCEEIRYSKSESDWSKLLITHSVRNLYLKE